MAEWTEQLSLGFIPQTSLSVGDLGHMDLTQNLSLGFIPQTSLSVCLISTPARNSSCLWGSYPRLR